MRIGIATSFPDGALQKSGIAYYAKTLIQELAAGPDEITVFADRVHTVADRPHGEERIGSHIRVVRCWRFGMLSPFMLALAIFQNPVDVLQIEYDVYQFGGVVVAILLPIMLMALRKLRGIEIVTTMHGIVSQRAVTAHMLRENGFVLPFSRIGKLGFRAVYGLFDRASDRIIVLEHQLAEILHSDYGVARKKIFVVPIPLMHETQPSSRAEAAIRCGIVNERSLIFVGYASYYKGLGILLDAFELARLEDPLIDLHIVAGRHPRLAGDRRYESFYSSLVRRAAEAGAKWHGFVPDAMLTDMLAASAAVIFPYTAAYGGSAALNLALGARRPVLVSSVVYFDGALPGQVFDPDRESCAKTIIRFFQHLQHILEAHVEEFARHRNVATIAQQVHRVRCGLGITELPQTQPQGLAPDRVGRAGRRAVARTRR